MWWLLASLVASTTAYINPKCTDLRTITQFFDKCRYEDGGKIMNCTDLPLLRLGPDIVKTNVETIYVDKCCMTFIPENTFQDARNLVYLDASHNLMRTLKLRVFSSTAQLAHLDVSYNFIQTFDYRTFLGLNKLSYLDTSNNVLQILDSRTFSGTNMLSFLDLSYNNLSVLDYRLFKPINELSHLNLSNNLIEILDYRIFSTANKLSYLNLSRNNLEILDYRIFNSMSKLSHLDLSLNSVKILDQRLFNNLTSLQYLNLRDNKLFSLEDSELFISQGQLITLLLARNNISTFQVNVLKPLKSIKVLDFSENPFFCNCELHLTPKWCSNKSLEINCTCANISYFSEFCSHVTSERNLSDDYTTEIIVGFTLGSAFLCAIFCVSFFLWKRNSDKKDTFPQKNNFIYDDVGSYYDTIGIENTFNPFYLGIVDHATNPSHYDYVTVDREKSTKTSSSYIEPEL